MAPAPPDRPDENLLFETAAAQEGLFTTSQAAVAGYSPQLLVHHVHAGRIVRVQRGIYRLVHYPPGTHEELVAAWLWSAQTGVVSHQTALALHELSDVLPARVHLTLPSTWQRRRLRVPDGVVVHYADLPATDRAWFGPVPVTNPCRTLNDCACANLSPELLRQAARQALQRRLVTRREIGDVILALRPFGGLAA